jgi:hypothetical protein
MTRTPDSVGRWTAALVGFAIVAVVWMPAWTQSPRGEPRGGAAGTARRTLIASGDAPDLFLLFTGDVIGYLDPCG